MNAWGWVASGLAAGLLGFLAVAAANYWLRGRADARSWDEIWGRVEPHCHLHTWPDGRSEWLYVQPEHERQERDELTQAFLNAWERHHGRPTGIINGQSTREEGEQR